MILDKVAEGIVLSWTTTVFVFIAVMFLIVIVVSLPLGRMERKLDRILKKLLTGV